MRNQDICTAGVIIIGNEILSGRTLDTNTQHIAQKLNDAGIVLAEAAVIPDVKERIIDTVRRFSLDYDYVFTTGGIGPTHDDITAESIAEAFGVELKENDVAKRLLTDHYQEELTEARMKMAFIPEGAGLIHNPVSAAPGFIVRNVYVMAGIPRIMQGMLDNILPTLKGGNAILSETVLCFLPESVLAKDLAQIQTNYPDIDIGSYPFFKDGGHGVNIVLRGYDAEILKNAKYLVLQAIDKLSQQV